MVIFNYGDEMIVRCSEISRLNLEAILIGQIYFAVFIVLNNFFMHLCCRVSMRVRFSFLRGIIYKTLFRS